MADQNPTKLTYEDVFIICKRVLEEVIGQKNYQHNESEKWNEKIVASVTEALVALQRQYMYCVTCIIMQVDHGAGLNVASCCYWNSATDEAFAYRWENKSIVAICNVFAVSF